MTRKRQLAEWLLFLFATPFAVVGVMALVMAWKLHAKGAGLVSFFSLILFGLAFFVIGSGIMAAALIPGKGEAQWRQLPLEHPNQPWLWREDWAQGRVRSKNRKFMLRDWMITVFVNLMFLPFLWLVIPMALNQRKFSALLVLVFPALGIYLLVRSIKSTLAYLKYGAATFQMESVPGFLGGELRGTIEAPFPHFPDHGVQLRLSSIHRVREPSGKGPGMNEWVMAKYEVNLDSGTLYAGPSGTIIPVSIPIPPDAHPTGQIGPSEEYAWLLDVKADTPGVNYHQIFEVPIFRNPDSPAPTPEAVKHEPTVGWTMTQSYRP